MTKIILGNWKQNGNLTLVEAISAKLKQLDLKTDVTVGIFPPFVYLAKAFELLKDSQIQIGSQNISATTSGAYTGEVSGSMLKEVGCSLVLIGHSERRQFFHDSDFNLADKFQQAIKAGLTPVLCVGETLNEYEQNQTQFVVRRQIEAILPYFSAPFMIAYEPVWAIGTGKAATKEQAEMVHQYIRQCLPAALQKMPILYGGSVKADNAHELLTMPNIDGVLVGGASLDPDSFVGIIDAAHM